MSEPPTPARAAWNLAACRRIDDARGMVIAVVAILAFVLACDVLELLVARRSTVRRRPPLLMRGS